MRQISGNKLLVKALKEEGVTTLFGYPGACTIDISDELYKQSGIDIILPRYILSSHYLFFLIIFIWVFFLVIYELAGLLTAIDAKSSGDFIVMVPVDESIVIWPSSITLVCTATAPLRILSE